MARPDLETTDADRAAECGERPFFLRRAVPPDLTGVVARLTGYQENGQALRQAPEAAAMVVPLVISFSDPFEIALSRRPTREDRYASFTSGLHPGYVMINSSGAAQCVQIDFTPLGAYRFFGLPMSEIAGRMVALEDLGDPGILELRDRLAALNDWNRRLDLVEEFMRRRIGAAGTDVSAVAWAYDAIMKRGGDTRVRDLAAALDWSRKHLNERFHQMVGVGPKTVARMARFNHAIQMSNAGDSGWADIAFAAGYADQAHMTREFREFAGTTPGQFARTIGG
jgi:AraC-like DNA-binding protein